jgi:two-component sensor histidine kinase
LPVNVPEGHPLGYLRQKLGFPGPRRSRPGGVFVLIHDATDALARERELESKMAMIREVHHRVKNNLQVIASLMRMQARRVSGAEARTVLEESVNRILSVAVVHEFLSQNAKGVISLLEVARRVLDQLQQNLIDPTKRVSLRVSGSNIWLPAERATQCALVINELVQNAVEHGLRARDRGDVAVELIDQGDRVTIVVADDGEGLPAGFDLAEDANLGLTIVRSMVERDLKGAFTLESDRGTRAIVEFSKSVLGGD